MCEKPERNIETHQPDKRDKGLKNQQLDIAKQWELGRKTKRHQATKNPFFSVDPRDSATPCLLEILVDLLSRFHAKHYRCPQELPSMRAFGYSFDFCDFCGGMPS